MKSFPLNTGIEQHPLTLTHHTSQSVIRPVHQISVRIVEGVEGNSVYYCVIGRLSCPGIPFLLLTASLRAARCITTTSVYDFMAIHAHLVRPSFKFCLWKNRLFVFYTIGHLLRSNPSKAHSFVRMLSNRSSSNPTHVVTVLGALSLSFSLLTIRRTDNRVHQALNRAIIHHQPTIR